MVFVTGDNFGYVYYEHFDGVASTYPCQFCKLIGRKRDVFECLNQSEWQSCPHYLLNAHRLRLKGDVPAHVQEEAA